MRLATLLLALVLPALASAQRDPIEVADAYGYTMSRSPAPTCPAEWIDTSAGTAPSLTAASGDATADDDGGARLTLPLPFHYYGEDRNAVVVSSNGYLAFADDLTVEDGGHWRADCPLPAIPDNTHASFARIYALLADLERGATGDLRWAHFASCPRASAYGAESCTVVSWRNWQQREIVGLLDLQVVLYHGSGEIALQYGALDTAAAEGTTVGIQNGDASSAAMARCGESTAPSPFSAVCLRDPNAVIVPSVSVQTSASPVDGGETSGGETVTTGAMVSLVATPAANYLFVNWTDGGSVVSTDAHYTFVAQSDRTLQANFESIPDAMFRDGFESP